MYNQITIAGNLGRDPESRETKNGHTIVTLAVATNHRQKNAQGEYENATTWHRVKVFGKQAEACLTYLAKGKKVLVTGRQENGSYENKEGQRVNTSEVVANEVKFLSGRDEGSSGHGGGSYGGGRSGGAPDPYEPPSSGHGPGNDDLPF